MLHLAAAIISSRWQNSYQALSAANSSDNVFTGLWSLSRPDLDGREGCRRASLLRPVRARGLFRNSAVAGAQQVRRTQGRRQALGSFEVCCIQALRESFEDRLQEGPRAITSPPDARGGPPGRSRCAAPMPAHLADG